MAFGYGLKYGNSYGLADPASLLVPSDRMIPLLGVSPSFTFPGIPNGAYSVIELSVTGAGPVMSALPLSAESQYVDGAFAKSFFDDIYNRMYILPTPVDLGVVTEDTTTNITVWNTYLSDVTLTAIEDSALESDYNVFVQDIMAPDVIKPLDAHIYSANAGVYGPTTISGHANFIFYPDEVIRLDISGFRGRLWRFLPNWSSGFSETLEYKTEIITARTGREQRIARRDQPRRSLDYALSVWGRDRADLFRELDVYKFVEHIFSSPNERLIVQDEVSLADVPYSVSSVPDWLVAGAVVTLTHGNTVEARYVESVDDSFMTVTFKDQTDTVFPAGTVLRRGLFGAISENTSVSRLSNDVANVQLSVELSPGRDSISEPPAAAVTFNSREVFLERPNWGDPVSVDFQLESDKIDYETGVTARFSTQRTGIRVNKANYIGVDPDRLKSLLATFIRARGQRGEFYMPTWDFDLTLRSPIGSTSTTIRVVGSGTANDYLNHPTFKNIAIKLRNGTWFFRKISLMAPVSDGTGSDSLLTMDSALGTTVNPDDVLMICWLPCCRFASDAVTIEHLTENVSQVQFAIRTLEDLTPE